VQDLEVSGLATNYRHKIIKRLELNEPNKEVLDRVKAQRPVKDSNLPTLRDQTRPRTHEIEPVRKSDSKSDMLLLLGKLSEVRQTSDYEGVMRGD
jgi:hypothetical protein